MSTADAATRAKPGAGAFAVLLRDHRLAAGLTQEELAERTGLSRRGISDLERGARRMPYGNTIRKLIDALDLDDAATKQLYAAARKPAGVTSRASTADTVPLARVPRLPIPVTSFVGREREVQSVVRLLSSTRLLTLVGTGGVGKTQLAAEFARVLESTLPNEVFVVELSARADHALVVQAVASAMEVREQSDRPLVDSLVSALQHRRVLVVLDNCEHLLGACAELVHTLLRTCSGLRILATSREPLRLAGEWRWRVPPRPCLSEIRARTSGIRAVRYVRGSRASGTGGVRRHWARSASHRRRLPPARWDSAGDRARRHSSVDSASTTSPGILLIVLHSDNRAPRRAAAPTDPPGNGGLELRPARPSRARAPPSSLHVRWWLDATSCPASVCQRGPE